MHYKNGTHISQRSADKGFSIVGFVVFILLLALVGFFGYRVWFYAGKIRSGEIIDLPQYRSSFTVSGEAPLLSGAVVGRSSVEKSDNPELGSGAADDPKLTIVEFADFQCPHCHDEHLVVRRLMAKYPDSVRFIYRDFPMESVHPEAFQASLAAECAREQGKFWAYHDRLYANQDALGFQDMLAYGEEAGLLKVQFETCFISERYREKVEEDIRDGKILGLQGTPTFFFNGQRLEGAIPEDVFARIIDEMIK